MSCPVPCFKLFGGFKLPSWFVAFFCSILYFLAPHFLSAKKISPSVIVASIEGEVTSLNMVDDFKVTMGPSSVGKKVNPKTILSTGKTGKVALLFSNGTLITIKPGSRFYLRTFKQLEGIVTGAVDPGKLEEEPTQSELSGHLDYGDLVCKAPKLKKGSSMKLTSPLGVAGIRGTMFQLMAVRNSVTGDIMGGVNLISGDIDFTDTGGNMVTLLSGQSIQLATSKLGEPVASKTGELVDLSSTYGPALTDGFAPPTPESIFPSLSESSSSDEDSESEDEFSESSDQGGVASSGSNFDFIHQMATEIFFEIEQAESSSSEFSFESMAIAPTVEIPTPESEAPTAPASVTGETLAGGDLEFFQGGYPEIALLGENSTTDPLFKVYENGARIEVEMRDPSEGLTWRKLDPWVEAKDFLGQSITNGVQISGAPKINVKNGNAGSYEVSYSVKDLRGLSALVFRQVDVLATPPIIEISDLSPSFPWNEVDLDNDGLPYDSFYQWLDQSVNVVDIAGNQLPYSIDQVPGTYSLSGFYDFSKVGVYHDLHIVATDWRGVESESEAFSFTISTPNDLPSLSVSAFFSSFEPLGAEEGVIEYGDPLGEFENWLESATAVDALGNRLTVTPKILGSIDIIPSEIVNIWPGESAEYSVVFEVIDPRWEQTGSDPNLKDELTQYSKSFGIRVIATPPKIELTFHNARPGLEITPDFDELSYLVRSQYNEELFPDDGPFSISPDPGEEQREDGKIYYSAFAYDGFGAEITEFVEVDNLELIDDEVLNEDTTLYISVDDKSIRGLSQGAISSLSTKVKIVDVLSPLLQLVDQDDPVEGIMPEITLLSGSLAKQVTGNSDSQFYFPDAGLEIFDNYYTADEIIDHNDISIINQYIFDYFYDADTVEYNEVWEFPSRSLDISKAGNYEISYLFNDPSGNLSRNYHDPSSSTLTRQVTVEDTREPVVKLYGSNPLYVDIESILNEESRYSDPGAYAIENLFVSGKGLFDWDTEDEELAWSVSYELCNDLENDTYDPRVVSSEDQIAQTIQSFIDDPSSVPLEVIRYRVNYSLTDQSGNVGEANRTIELRGSPNKFPHINFSFDENGVPSSSNIIGQIAYLDEATPWVVEVGVNQFSTVPDADVYDLLASGVKEDVQYSTEILFLDESNSSLTKPTLANDLSFYLSKVNYWSDNQSKPHYVLFDEQSESYDVHEKGLSSEWRRVVIRYTSVENGFGNKSVRDLEVRLQDTTRPVISLTNSTIDDVEVGAPFDDPENFPDISVNDSADSLVVVEHEINIGNEVNSTFEELGLRGFWGTGTFSITYSAEDEFDNEAYEQQVTFDVIDTTPPHVALVSHGLLSALSSNSVFSVSNVNFSGTIPSGVDPYTIFQGTPGDTGIRDKLIGLSYDSSSPYIAQKEDSDTDINLYASEFVSFDENEVEKITLSDNFNRSYAWYSPCKILLSDGTEIQDPGVLVYEPSNEDLTFSSIIVADYYDPSNQQIRTLKVSVRVTQQNGLSTISGERTYTFLDDLKPTITLTPDTDLAGPYILVEAGETYSDTNGTYYFWENGAKGNLASRTVTVNDIVDDQNNININVQRSYFDDDNASVTLGSFETNLGEIYKVKYDAQDSEGNEADPVYRWLIVQDTKGPTISWDNVSSFEINSSNSLINDENSTKNHILQSLNFSATDPNGVTPDADLSHGSGNWEVSFSPDFQTGEIYPLDRTAPGYTVTVRVKDNVGNYNLSPITFELKVGDYNAPVITYIGAEEIHDFLRYGSITGSSPDQLAFADQDDSQVYDSTGEFSSGAHRLILSDYNFTDPGVWAEDESFDSTIYPDLDNDGQGESYAIKRVTNESDMQNPSESGVIYAYSYLNTNTLAGYQRSIEDGFPANDPGPTEPNATVIPDFDNDGSNDIIDVHEVTIQYRVKDAWDNLSDIKERRVYIYISKQYANSAFYATPLYTKDGSAFTDLYDTNRTTFGQANPFLSSLQKDYDGDGVSDYWENIFGTRTDDASDKPSAADLENPQNAIFKSLSQIPQVP